MLVVFTFLVVFVWYGKGCYGFVGANALVAAAVWGGMMLELSPDVG